MANLTDKDRRLLALAWQCFKTTPEVDYPQLARLGSYKTPASATSCFLSSKKKLLSADATVKLTGKDWELLMMAWKCFKIVPKVDYARLAQLGGYKTAASATSCYLAAKKKLLGGGEEGASKSPSSTKGRKRKAADADDGGVGEMKRGVKKNAAKKVKKNEEMVKGQEGDDGGAGIKIDRGQGSIELEREDWDRRDSVVVKQDDSEEREEMHRLYAGAVDYLHGEKDEGKEMKDEEEKKED